MGKSLGLTLGIIIMVLALAIAIVPVFTDCQSQGLSLTTSTGKEVAMKCHWTGVAEIGVAVPLLAVGALMLFFRQRSHLLILGVLGIVLGGLTIALPGNLIGVCQTPTMMCVTVMKPALIVLGSLALIVSIVVVALSRKARE